ncbi:corrinoid protein [Sporomusa acidovorans]|uniref:Methionine synthase n=1 Tax=Sporomusa acidovorans (strain ATCC 49682 / DSM 3132 / Mol) TaxID=1123286 RepID=A0ABZ3IXH2_SPOA4|nr:corrinoid protein [Sporomusa acidovorans]OZC22393.1 methionine synthase [Sporomusa acidovorans DSM 3132]SDE47885.1 Methanogenic corrinoid protein MtbC1 [Sporomusa acidovorans]
MIYAEIADKVKNGDAEAVRELCGKALAQGYPALVILEKGLICGMDQIADKYSHRRVIVPEVLLSSRAMHAGLAVLEPHMKYKARRQTGTIVIGTVAGDLHDIGKNLVKLTIMGTGAHIVDLGIDVTPQRFLQAVEKHKAEILMMAALLTTTMPCMKKVIKELEAADMRQGLIVCVGGAPVDETFARAINADCYFKCAKDAKSFLDHNLSKIVLRRKVAT